MSNQSSQLDAGIVIRRSLFLLVLLILTLGNLFVLFRGLESPQGMEQAQISREIARGNGFTTKMIRPVAYFQAEKAQKGTVSFFGFQDTYQSPLNPLLNAAVLKLIGADDAEKWQMKTSEWIFPLDRVIATVSTLFFLMAIGVNYLLISRIFDAKIAGVCAILMLFCETFWSFSLSGLPQMLMLLLFSCGIYFVYRAVEAASEGRLAFTPAIIAGIFFTLLALTHWLTVWIALGYIIYAAIAFRPRGIIGLSILALILIPASLVMLRNQGISASPFGTAYLSLYNGLAGASEASVMRATDLQSAPEIQGIIVKVLRMTLVQMTDIIPFLGGIVIAPLFFLALLHPFKRASIANFRWAILLMWVSAAFGMAFFGVSKEDLDSNQLHLLFAPIMAAYGLAFISILWSRLEFVASMPLLRNAHHIVIVGICAFPLILALPQKVTVGLYYRDHGGTPHWPPYLAGPLNSKSTGLQGWVDPTKQVVFSDQPWAVAWYADRVAIWLPPTRAGFEKLEALADGLQTPVAGIVISPSSHGAGTLAEVAAENKDFTSLVLDGRVTLATMASRPTQQFPRDGFSIYDKDQRIEGIAKRYPYRKPLYSLDMVFYSSRAIVNTYQEERQ